MDLRMSTILADTDITAQASRLASNEGMGGFFLDLRQVCAVFAESLIGRLENLLDGKRGGCADVGTRRDPKQFLEFSVSHVFHLPAGQKDLQSRYAKTAQDGDRWWWNSGNDVQAGTAG